MAELSRFDHLAVSIPRRVLRGFRDSAGVNLDGMDMASISFNTPEGVEGFSSWIPNRL